MVVNSDTTNNLVTVSITEVDTSNKGSLLDLGAGTARLIGIPVSQVPSTLPKHDTLHTEQTIFVKRICMRHEPLVKGKRYHCQFF